MKKFGIGLLMLASLAAAGCDNTQTPSGNTNVSRQAPPPLRSAPPPQSAPNAKATYTAAPPVGDVKKLEQMQAVIDTDKGPVTIVFFPKDAPQTVSAFVKLSQDGFYDGLTFHRVEPGFVVQGGDPEGTGMGGPGYHLKAEFNPHKHERGAVAMARAQDPDSAGSQFYICLDAAPSLDGKYTVFGQVVSGMENVDKIAVGDHIKSIKIQPKGAAAAAPAGASPAAKK